MKQLKADFATIFKKDRDLILWMLADFGLSAWLFFECVLHLNPKGPARWRYSDFSGYQTDSWWYILSFAIMAVVLGVGHVLISVRLRVKRGGDVARLFLGISCAIVVLILHALLSLNGR